MIGNDENNMEGHGTSFGAQPVQNNAAMHAAVLLANFPADHVQALAGAIAGAGAAAIAAAGPGMLLEGPIAAILVDLDAPGGADTAAQIRSRNRNVPILVLTDELTTGQARDCALLDNVDLLPKAAPPEILTAKIRLLLRNRDWILNSGTLWESMPLAAFKVDARGAILSANAEARRLFRAADPAGMAVGTLIADWASAPGTFNTTGTAADGSRLPIRVISTQTEEAGSVIFSTFIQDLAQEDEIWRCLEDSKAREKQFADCESVLKRHRDLMRQFAYSIGHDFQEPLRMVVSYTQLLQQRYANELDSKAKPMMDFTIEGALRLNALLRGLCECLELESSSVDMNEQVDCESLLDQALEGLVNPDPPATVITRDPLPKITGSAERLRIVFRHLITNGIKFNENSERRIHVSAHPSSDGWIFSIRDNGVGIDSSQLERAFGMFKKLNGSKYPGAGVGLPVSSRIVEQHGGRLWVESEPGLGSTFRFLIPDHSQTR